MTTAIGGGCPLFKRYHINVWLGYACVNAKARLALVSSNARGAGDRRPGRRLGAPLSLRHMALLVRTLAWHVIDSLCHPPTHPLFEGDFNAWANPDPKRDFQLSIAFAIQRGNVRMLQRCASRRACNRSRGAYSSRLPLVGA